ncbi:MerR family transcriptional regulator [Pseudochelatococcus contaminans]|uniref:DNA-binding transcriptional MerR regulator n=1 Tax=Pseudochelatococcus contaminans TaxID=1538103 RepID=A0A7W5Z5R5_9HYPH|nr:MerR family transcriptional regulator [Pseudochelatococcus contaminans]MBB3810627.1 DNA-binding transcriptional MerR regulator [Pseudochelatococcus contaminans]
MKTGKFVERSGLTPRTIDHYENLGLLKLADRKEHAHRHYDEAVLERVKTITALTQIGLSLSQVGDVIDLYCEDPATIASRDKILATLAEHLVKVDSQLVNLCTFRDKIQSRITEVGMLNPAVPQEG